MLRIYKKRRLLIVLSLVMVAALALAGCQKSPDTEQGDKNIQVKEITIATGGAGGPYHTIATGLAEIWNEKIEGINVTVASTGASVINNRMVNEGKAELAFTMSDIAYYGNKGVEMFDSPLENVMGFSAMHTNFVQLITTKDSGINSVYELKGKRVGVGAPGSGTELNARHVLAAHGITYEDLAKADYLSYAETCEQLANRNIDAGFLTGGLPIAAITELATTQNIKIIPIEAEIVEKMKKDFPIYIAGEIPAGTYRGVEENVPTLAMKNYLIINKDVDTDLAYELVSVMYENLERLQEYHAAVKQIKLEKALEGMVLPLHPGVERFYKEKGIK